MQQETSLTKKDPNRGVFVLVNARLLVNLLGASLTESCRFRRGPSKDLMWSFVEKEGGLWSSRHFGECKPARFVYPTENVILSRKMMRIVFSHG